MHVLPACTYMYQLIWSLGMYGLLFNFQHYICPLKVRRRLPLNWSYKWFQEFNSVLLKEQLVLLTNEYLFTTSIIPISWVNHQCVFASLIYI